MAELPYIITEVVEVKVLREYNSEYGDDRTCECGHRYYRHFDSHEYMQACGCKYCCCCEFVEGVVQVGKTCSEEDCGGVLTWRHRDDLVCNKCWTAHHTHKPGSDHPSWLTKTPMGEYLPIEPFKWDKK